LGGGGTPLITILDHPNSLATKKCNLKRVAQAGKMQPSELQECLAYVGTNGRLGADEEAGKGVRLPTIVGVYPHLVEVIFACALNLEPTHIECISYFC